MVLAEGTRGPLTQAWQRWQNVGSENPQIFALGVKEVWEVARPLEKSRARPVGDQAGSTMRELVSYLSITKHFEDFAKGIIDTKHVVYYLSFITFGLFLTAKSVDSERWRG